MTFPIAYKYAGAPTPDSVRYVHTDSTPSSRREWVISRKQAVFNAQTQKFSIAEYREVLRDDVVVEGLPNGQRATIDITLRMPVGYTEEKMQSLLDDALVELNDEAFLGRAFSGQFPVTNFV